MTCRISGTAAQMVWPSLSELSQHLRGRAPADEIFFDLVRGSDGWSLDGKREGWGRGLLRVEARRNSDEPENAGQFDAVSIYDHESYLRGGEAFDTIRGVIDAEELAFFRLYLPLIVGGWRARLGGRSFVTAHVAQTLDGRIACTNGHSQWISNEANLHHSHRLRALHDGVLVGRATVESDDPQLTVRHVPGRDPVRVVLSGRGGLREKPGGYHVLSGTGSVVLCETDAEEKLANLPECVDVVSLPGAPSDEGLAAARICDVLRERDLHSLFVEGGSQTLSSFIQGNRIDALHVHIAPRILGSGVSSFALPTVSRIQDGLALQMNHFDLDGELLLECRRLPQ